VVAIQSGFDFSHRRQWIVDRIKLLCSVFAVDLCAYAIKHRRKLTPLSPYLKYNRLGPMDMRTNESSP